MFVLHFFAVEAGIVVEDIERDDDGGMHLLAAYGLSIDSEIELPELLPLNGSGRGNREDLVTIRRAKIAMTPDRSTEVGPLLWARPGDACIVYEGVAAFHVRGGREVLVDPCEGAEAGSLRLFLLGPVLAILLHQRGLLVLHASAVSVGGSVAAFAAEKGEGKSTLAAAMHARGHPLVSDDLLPIDLSIESELLVHPGFPQLKLMPEAAAQLSANPDDLPRLHPGFEKRAQMARRDFPREPLPLSRIFIIESAGSDGVDEIAPQQRFVELVRHSYLAPLLGKTGESASHFKQVVELARRVPVLRLRRRRQLDLLPAAVRMIETEMGTMRPA